MSELPRPKRFTLTKQERLCRKRAFEYLFKHGYSLRVGVLHFLYAFNVPSEWSQGPAAIAFSAPKRRYPKAVTRNYLKRRMREAYRLNKYILLDELIQLEKNIIVLIRYQSRHIAEYPQIRRAMVKGLHLLAQEASQSTEDEKSPN